MKRITSVEDHKLTAAYESLRKTLRAEKYSDRRDKPLAYWALAKDRRLPMALLGYTLKDLLSQSFDELSATPGVGKKKLGSLLKLLHRATKENPPGVTPSLEEVAAKAKTARTSKDEWDGFNPAIVSELLWEQWRNTVRQFGLQEQTLGRLGPSLYRLPTVIWSTPLSNYLDLSVHQIRRLKTHGEKRVAAILEVFYRIHETLGSVPRDVHLHVSVRPKFAVPIERWINGALKRSQPPGAADLKRHVVAPILDQLRIDAGPQVFRIVEERLGVNSAPHPVQRQAKRLGVTRARVYQLLETCGDIMSVRWPEGEELFGRLHRKLASFPKARTQAAQLRSLTELIYPKLEYKSAPALQRGRDLSSKPQGAAQQSARGRRIALDQEQPSKSNGSSKRGSAVK